MKKFFTYTALVVAVLVVAAYIAGTFFLGSIVKSAVNRSGPRLTQSRVVLEGATISPFTGTGTLTGFTVENPAGWSAGKALYVGTVHFSVKPLSLLSDRIVVNSIEIDQAEFTYETKLVASNIGDLLKNIEAAGGGAKEPKAAPEGKPSRFEVKHFRLTNGKVKVGVIGKELPMDMPPIELNDLGADGNGITGGQLSAALLKSVTASVVATSAKAAGHLGTNTGAAAIEEVKKAGEKLKDLFKK